VYGNFLRLSRARYLLVIRLKQRKQFVHLGSDYKNADTHFEKRLLIFALKVKRSERSGRFVSAARFSSRQMEVCHCAD